MYKILIADDEQEMRNGIANYFPWNEIGFEIVGFAENGQQALDYISKNSIDVLLCDIKMPIISGLDVAQELYSRKCQIKIVFMTGYKDFDYAYMAMKYKVNNFILKPTKYHDLLSVFMEIKGELDNEIVPQESENREICHINHGFDYYEKVLSNVKEYIQEHYKTVTLDDVAKLIHMHPAYLSKIFKERTRENFIDYVITVKMIKAAELLKDIKYKTYEISEVVGYSSPKNFTRAFKKYFNKTPREYRNTTTK